MQLASARRYREVSLTGRLPDRGGECGGPGASDDLSRGAECTNHQMADERQEGKECERRNDDGKEKLIA